MNSDFMQEQSAGFREAAGSVRAAANRTCAVRLAYSLALARAPRKNEMELAQQFFRKDRAARRFLPGDAEPQ